jgi:DNA repair exonuclease SbcCD nuclease subunit
MKTSRRKFIKGFALTSAYLLSEGVKALPLTDLIDSGENVVLRLAVGSDGHYGQPNTEYDKFFGEFVEHITRFHEQLPLDACVVNGDIIHDKPEFLRQSKQWLDKLPVPYYVTQGNHDMVSAEYWQQTWNRPVNEVAVVKGQVLLMMTTSNEKGEYLSPDLDWLKHKLEEHRKNNVLLFLHIGQHKWTPNCIDNSAYAELIIPYKNLKAVFHGHDHDQDGVKILEETPHIFDSHIGGSWGTPYRGYRIVEVMKNNQIRTYMMNPLEKVNETVYKI